jgi:hypothetical protein
VKKLDYYSLYGNITSHTHAIRPKNKKVKVLVHCIEAYGGVEFRSFTHSDLRHKIGVNSLLHATSLFPTGYEALVYIDQEAGNPTAHLHALE